MANPTLEVEEGLPPETPPPPLPSSLPPSAEKADRRGPAMATMYENVWIDSGIVGSGKVPQSSPPALPVVPPRYRTVSTVHERSLPVPYGMYCTVGTPRDPVPYSPERKPNLFLVFSLVHGLQQHVQNTEAYRIEDSPDCPD